MQLYIYHFIFLVVGLLIGYIYMWRILNTKLALANTNISEGELIRASLSEQFKAASNEILDYKTRLSDTETLTQKLQAELDKASRECAQFVERAARLSTVEVEQKETKKIIEKFNNNLSDLRELNGRLSSDIEAKKGRLIELDDINRKLSTERDVLLRSQAEFKAEITGLKITLDKEQTQAQEKLVLLNEAREQLSNQFKVLANEILEEKSRRFTDQNQTNINQLLNPLKLQLTEFKTKIEDVYINEGKDRSALAEQVKQLTQLNNTLSQDAQNLTLALKGNNKAQGNWGEIILEDILEKAGLIAGQHYDRQGAVKSEDGQKTYVIPDVVIHLPGDRHLVVDAKMTLPDYRAFASADSNDERDAALKNHLISIRSHISGLSKKNYQSLYGLKSLDFVVMFIPLEPAFMLAVTHDSELFQNAWEKNILLVSPSTLLFVIRTVAYLWRQDALSRNAKEISSRGALLYDKFAGFVKNLQEVGKSIQAAQASYDKAYGQLSEGQGNLIGQAEKLKDLGVKSSKELPAQWVNSANDESLPNTVNVSEGETK